MKPFEGTTSAGEQRAAAIMLVIVTAFWGLSFPLVKTWQDAATPTLQDEVLASFTLIALRMIPGLLLLIVCKPDLWRDLTRRELACGGLLGFVFFLGFSLQLWALAQQTVTPALSAFLTCLGSVWTPLLAWLVLGMRLRPILVPGLMLAVGGTALLSWRPGEAFVLNAGVVMTLLASVLFACQILLLDRLGRTVRATSLTVGFFVVAGLVALLLALVRALSGIGVAEWARWTWDFHQQPGNLACLILLVLLPTVLSFYWMNTYQPRVSASRAALIYLLEPVFAAMLSIPWGLDRLSVNLVAGGTLIVMGNALVELYGAHSTPTGVGSSCPSEGPSVGA